MTMLLKKKGRFIDELRQIYSFVPPGHFYSPLPSCDDIRRYEEQVNTVPDSIPGVDLNEEEQMHLLNQFIRYYEEMPFQSSKTEKVRYYFENEFYSYPDAIILYAMIRHLKPEKIIECGSGYSSCVMLDTNELFFDNTIECTFIEPYPESLLSLINDDDKKRIHLIPQKIQDVEFSTFSSLSAGDILFIDSSHVSRINSDVNHVFFRILPHLSSGVYIHFHDIFYPFEYPVEWTKEGRVWTETYLLHAFLQYNSSFEVVFFNSFMEQFHKDRLKESMPLCLKNGGGSIWIKKK